MKRAVKWTSTDVDMSTDVDISTNVILLPKVPQKVQILENKKDFIFSEFKNTTFLFGQR